MFKDVKVGDLVTREMCGRKELRQKWKVTGVTPDLITIGMGWTFDPKTGAEIDEDLHWGPKYGATGSFLVKE